MADTYVFDGQAAPSGASGVATIDLPVVLFEHEWRVRRISISGNSLTIPYCEVFRKVGNDLYRVDYTDSGNNDVSEYPDELVVQQAEVLRIRWTGCSGTNVQMQASIQYDDLDLRKDAG